MTLQKMPGTYELVGVVDETSWCKTPRFGDYSALFKDVPRLTEEEMFKIPDLDAVFVEVPNLELVPVAMRVMEHGCRSLSTYRKQARNRTRSRNYNSMH